MAWKPLVRKIEKARFVSVNFTPERMAEIAVPVVKSIQDRIYEGLNDRDQFAKPLSPRYAKQKQRKGRKPIRNLTMTGRFMASMHVLKATNGQAIIGFTDPMSQRKAYHNNAREVQFSMSPRNTAEFAKQVASKPIVSTRGGNGTN